MEKLALPDFIESNTTCLVNLWLQRLPVEVFEPSSIKARTRQYLENAIPDILKTLARVLRDPDQSKSVQYFESLSKEHVDQRIEYFNVSFS